MDRPETFFEGNELRVRRGTTVSDVKRVEGVNPGAIQAMVLHEQDLAACGRAIEVCVQLGGEDEHILKTLWTGILVRYVKCFAPNGARRPYALKEGDIFASEELLRAHAYFSNVRNSHA